MDNNILIIIINLFLCLYIILFTMFNIYFLFFEKKNSFIQPSEINKVENALEDDEPIDLRLKEQLDSFYERIDEIKLNNNISENAPDYNITGVEIVAPSYDEAIDRRIGM